MRVWLFDRMPVPPAEIVVAKDTLAFANQGEVSPVILGIVKNVDEHFSAESNSYLQAISPFLCHRYGCLGEMGCNLASDLDFKSVEFLFRVH